MTPAECQELIKASTFLGESAGFWIQTVVFFLSAIAAIFALVYNARQLKLLKKQNESNEKQARLRATIDIVMNERQDAHFQAHRKMFSDLKEKSKKTPQTESLTKFACGVLSTHEDENSAILGILNSYEFMAVGIFEGAFDEETYRKMRRSLVIADWNALEAYVIQLRSAESRPELFVQIEKLVKDWKDK